MPNQKNAQLIATELLEHLSTATIVFDSHGRFVYLNQAAETNFQTSRKTLQGQRYNYFITSDSLPLRELMESLQDNGTFYHDDITIELLNERSVKTAMSARWITLDDTYLLVECYDTQTIQKHRDTAHLREQNLITNRLVQQLAHEIKNPLSGIKGASQLLSMEISNNTEHQEYLSIIDNEINRLNGLVDRLLFKRPNNSRVLVNIHEITEAVIGLTEISMRNQNLQSPQDERSATIQRDYDPSLPDMLLAPESIHQALLNLLNNAIEANHDNPERAIRVRTRALHQHSIGHVQYALALQIQVIDNGSGIPEELQSSIFYPLISSKKQLGLRNSGLGLSIAQDLIQQQHGLIQFTSKPGETTFSITLPYTQEASVSEESS